MNRLSRWALVVTCSTVLGAVGGLAHTADITLASPESVGFSAEGLKAYQNALRALVDQQRLAGFTTLVARRGKVVAFDAHGYKDVSAKTPMTRDTIFRIASMTKPIAGVAMMMLWEQASGRWRIRFISTSPSSPA